MNEAINPEHLEVMWDELEELAAKKSGPVVVAKVKALKEATEKMYGGEPARELVIERVQTLERALDKVTGEKIDLEKVNEALETKLGELGVTLEDLDEDPQEEDIEEE